MVNRDQTDIFDHGGATPARWIGLTIEGELSPLRELTVHRLRTVLRLKPLASSEAPVVAHPAHVSRIRRTGRLQ